MKSLIMFQIKGQLNITNETLKTKEYVPCGEYTKSSLGFCPTFDGEFVTEAAGKTIFNLAFSEKKPATAEVNRRVKALCRAYEREFDKKPNKKLQDEYKEAVINQLLPSTFESEVKNFVIFIQDDIMYVEAPSYNKGDDFITLLREAIGSLPIVSLSVELDVSKELNRMVTTDLSEDICLGNKTSLSMGEKEDKEDWSGKGPTCNEEAREFIINGFDVMSLELNCDFMNFNIKNDMLITGIKFSSGIFSSIEVGDKAGTVLLVLDEVVKMAGKLVKEFGGIETTVEE